MASIRLRNGSYQVRVRHKGFKDQVGTFATRTEAKAWARQVSRSAVLGFRVHPPPLGTSGPDHSRGPPALLKRSYASQEGCSPRTRRIKRWQFHPFALCPFDSINGVDLASYSDACCQDRAQYHPSGPRADLSLVMRWLAGKGDMERLDNLAKNVRKPPKGRTRRLAPRKEAKLPLAYPPRTKGEFTVQLYSAASCLLH
jgi:hypothetical protein